MYIDQGRVTDNAVHVESRITTGVEKAGKNFNVNTVNHCIFCLRRTTANPETSSNNSASTDDLKEVPCAPPEYSTSAASPLLFALNKIWSHVQKNGCWEWDDDPGNAEQRSTQFKCFPKICYFCGDKISSICDLMCQLKEEINKLGVIIRESKKGGSFSWRAESFERALKDSAVERQCISDTLEFLGIPQENQSSSVPASLDTIRLGVTLDTDMPSVITGEELDQQPKEEESSPSHFNFHDEGSADDASSSDPDEDTDPNYVKEEEVEDSFSDSKDSDSSAAQDLDGDPLGDDSDSKPELDQPLPSGSTIVDISTVTTLSQNSVSRRSRGKSDWLAEVRTREEREQQLSDQQQKPKHVCSICGKTLSNLGNLRQHIKKIHSKSRQQQQQLNTVCSVCGKKFKLRHYFIEHVKKCVRRVEKLRCDLCRVRVPVPNLYEHVRVHVGEEYLIRCPNPNTGQCSFVCCTPRGLQIHLRANEICRTATPDVNDKYLTPRDAFICQVCGEDRGSRRGLRRHLNTWHEHGIKEFLCPIPGCERRFSFRQSVLLHIAFHVSEMKRRDSQPCDVCKEKIKFEEMEQHLKDAHHLSEETIIKCFNCPSLFSERTNHVDHLYVHRHIAVFCDICGDPDTTFYQHTDLRRHYFQVHQIGNKILCEHCQAEFFSVGSLEGHLAKRHKTAAGDPKKQIESRKEPSPGCSSSAGVSSDAIIAEKKFKCDECDAAYKTKAYLTFHKITIHEGNLLPCKFCDRMFPSIARKKAHEAKHRRGPVGPKKEKFPCQVPGCEKELSSKFALKNHIAWAHEGQKAHVCDQCGKAYPSPSSLNSHMQSVHMGVRDHVCDVCGETFSHGTVLKRHKLIHTGDRPFACQLCGQKFRQKEVLKKHVDTHERKGADFKPNGPMKQIRKRVEVQSKTKKAE